MDDILDEDNDEIEKRWIGVAGRVLRMLGPVIKRWGSKALKFFKCVGLDANLITCSMKVHFPLSSHFMDLHMLIHFFFSVLQLRYHGHASLEVRRRNHLHGQGWEELCQEVLTLVIHLRRGGARK